MKKLILLILMLLVLSGCQKVKENVTYTENDKIAIANFEKIEASVDAMLENDKTKEVQKEAKGIFISVVDFIFYDGEIKGVTFKELSEEGKKKVLQIAASIDQKIESSFPNYKENISKKAGSALAKAGELIKKGANNINDFAEQNLGEENYQAIIDAKDELASYTKSALDLVEDLAGSLLNKGVDALQNWYQNFKNKD